MVYRTGDKVIVDGEECEVLIVYGGGTGYMVETPDGDAKKVIAEQVSEVEEDKEPEGEGEGEGEGGEGKTEEEEPKVEEEEEEEKEKQT